MRDTAEVSHAEWENILKANFKAQSLENRAVRFPSQSSLRLGGNAQRATMHLASDAVIANMQDDKAAFEAWALVLLRWCCAEQVVMSWDMPAEGRGDRHHQRFLYRAKRFCELMCGRFALATPERLEALRITDATQPYINQPDPRRIPEAVAHPRTENEIEIYLSRPGSGFGKHLHEAHGIRILDRQFPVGVFAGTPASGAEIFTGRKSAIDLIGKDGDGGIWIFELKKPGEIPIGALSELLLYAHICRDVAVGAIRFVDRCLPNGCLLSPADILGARRIQARLTATDIHPLIDEKLLMLLNHGSNGTAVPIDYGLLDLSPFLPAQNEEVRA